MNRAKIQFNTATHRPGLALVVTLVILVVLASIVYSLAAQIATIEHRKQYFIDYQNAQYAVNSAMKYALANMQKIAPELIDRKEAPDFSDLFTLDEFEYQEMLEEWAILQNEKIMLEWELKQQEDEDDEKKSDEDKDKDEDSSENKDGDSNQPDEQDSLLDKFACLFGLAGTDPNLSEEELLLLAEEEPPLVDPNDLEIPGPYGQPWPQITKSVEFEINNAKITIQYEDENAKMPLTWALTKDKSLTRQAQAALQTFSEWMQMDESQIEDLVYQLEDIAEEKEFKINPKDVVEITKTPIKTSGSGRRTKRATVRTKTKKKTIRSAIGHTTDFAKLLHSSMLDLETLAAPLPNTGDRYEAPIKYLALWGSQRVNINTAPRHVLEAAFTFGGDAEEIATEIIALRQEKPFKDIKDLKARIYGYNDSISDAENFITTTSKYFSIKVTASSGRAKVAAVATIIKDDDNFQRIAIITQ